VLPHHTSGFFADLNTRISALGGLRTNPVEYIFYDNVGHRPSWVNRDAAAWLDAKLRFPRWQNLSLDSLGETHIAEWATATGATINRGYASDKSEGGIHALGHGFPALSRAQLQVIPEVEWQAHSDEYCWQELAKRILRSQGLAATVLQPSRNSTQSSTESKAPILSH